MFSDYLIGLRLKRTAGKASYHIVGNDITAIVLVYVCAGDVGRLTRLYRRIEYLSIYLSVQLPISNWWSAHGGQYRYRGQSINQCLTITRLDSRAARYHIEALRPVHGSGGVIE